MIANQKWAGIEEQDGKTISTDSCRRSFLTTENPAAWEGAFAQQWKKKLSKQKRRSVGTDPPRICCQESSDSSSSDAVVAESPVLPDRWPHRLTQAQPQHKYTGQYSLLYRPCFTTTSYKFWSQVWPVFDSYL